jgi:phage repressor protein C with HTH and peptisase S24 domain
MSVSDRIREIADNNSLTLKQLSEKIQIKYRTIQNYVGEVRPVSAEFLMAMDEHLGVSASWLLNGSGPTYREHLNSVSQVGNTPKHDTGVDFIAIPRYEVSASAGYGSLVEAVTGSGAYAFNPAFIQRRGLNPRHLSVIGVSGDSMEPDLSDGDLILIATDQTDPKNGFMYAVHYDDQLFVKRIQRLPGKRLHLVSANDSYPPVEVDMTVNQEVRVVGRVVASMHEW